MFSAFATQGLERKDKGEFTRDELAPLAKINVESLKEYDYFTFATADGKQGAARRSAADYFARLQGRGAHAALHAAVQDAGEGQGLKIEIYDPTIFVDFSFAKDKPVQLVGAPRLQARRGAAARDDLSRKARR